MFVGNITNNKDINSYIEFTSLFSTSISTKTGKMK